MLEFLLFLFAVRFINIRSHPGLLNYLRKTYCPFSNRHCDLLKHHKIKSSFTDEGSVPEMRIWSILLIKSDLKWCIHLSISLFLYS